MSDIIRRLKNYWLVNVISEVINNNIEFGSEN